MISVISGIITAAASIGDKLIEDKDKKAEYAFKMQELAQKQMEVLINQETYKWIDGLVKLSYAGEQIVKGLIRPVGAMALAGFAAYCDMSSIELSPAIEAMLYGSPLAWGYSRHAEKKQ